MQLDKKLRVLLKAFYAPAALGQKIEALLSKCMLILAVILIPSIGLAADLGGIWQGTYTCNQGLTGLTLVITAPDQASIRAVFRFNQVDENPGVPDGCFTMSGTVRGNSVVLHAVNWLYRPRRYVMVDIVGAMSADATTLTGSIFGPNCTTFALHRIFNDADPAACRPQDAPVS